MTGGSVSNSGESTPTSSSLLERVKAREADAWERLVRLYGHLVYKWCRQAGLQEADVADVGQEVFQAVANGIATFRRDREGDSFQGWLRTITRNKLCDFLRRKQQECPGVGGSDYLAILQQIEDKEPAGSASTTCDAPTDREEKLAVCRRAVEMILNDCKEPTRQAFRRVVIEGHEPLEVARDLGMTLNAVYLVKSRILRRFRDEFAGLEDLERSDDRQDIPDL